MKIVLACGGTGGHIFPAFSVAEELKKRNTKVELIYVCGQRDLEQPIFKIVRGEKIIAIESAPFRGKASLVDPSFFIKIFRGFKQAASFLKKEKPDLVVGFGGYAAFPVVWWASLCGFKTLIHEQNVVPGITNKFLARFAKGIALSFSETAPYFKNHRNKRLTGNPIRTAIETADRKEALQFFSFSESKRTLLVLGGSQGAESINTVFLQCLDRLGKEWEGKIQVLHLCGKMAVSEAQKAYDRAGIEAKIYSFFDRMDLVYAVTDAALGRAGATFLAEIEAKNIPAVLVPYPHGNGHQLVNAQVFSQKKEARLIEQKNLTPETLLPALYSFFEKDGSPSRGRAEALFSRLRLAEWIEEMAHEH